MANCRLTQIIPTVAHGAKLTDLEEALLEIHEPGVHGAALLQQQRQPLQQRRGRRRRPAAGTRIACIARKKVLATTTKFQSSMQWQNITSRQAPYFTQAIHHLLEQWSRCFRGL